MNEREEDIEALVEAGLSREDAIDTLDAADRIRAARTQRDPLEDPEGVWDAQGHRS